MADGFTLYMLKCTKYLGHSCDFINKPTNSATKKVSANAIITFCLFFFF